ncbi:MAG: hypothetical protein IPQ03_09430 [Bacteroidetes bacterium]|jgi:hypothetical protein|nr:hypothetical protein [Bacteroidota bacterium]MBK9524951.1 hypothetical protein [Bacteroidota bacterium]MBK9543120.1 hypothetical protein [Bacteroidota bacterium]MBL0257725.1 hypothetical protein [Bacteroidota bacterium]MBP6402104.1 hypothetical protein [Bacteroidia bacterium]
MKLSLIYLSLFLSSCTSGTKNSPAVADAAEAKSADVVAAPAVAKPEEPEDTNYIRHVELGDYKFTAAIKGAQLSVTVQKGENILPAYSRECSNQTLTKCFVSDLNSNGFPEFYIGTSKQNPAGGTWGSLYSYEIKNNEIKEALIPEMTSAMKNGYRGKDQWLTDENLHLLMHKFKLYLLSDADCCPTGGERTINYVVDASGAIVFKNTQSLERVVVPGKK